MLFRSGRTDCVDVTASVNESRGINTFRRNVQWRSGERVGSRHARLLLLINRLDQSEVEDLDDIGQASSTIQHDIGRLDVTVHQSFAVSFVERTTDLQQQMDHSGLRLWSCLIHEGFQIDAIKEFHGVVEHTFRSASVIIDGNGVGIIQLAGDLHFTFEAGN